jgi:hypothetical protein
MEVYFKDEPFFLNRCFNFVTYLTEDFLCPHYHSFCGVLSVTVR